jgi:AcrR family transcriptional regulator
MAKAARNTQNSKSEILASAIEVIRRSGAPSLTIDAVAEESGFSKGGVLYNFPTKDALITGMVEFLVGQFEADVKEARSKRTGSRSPTLCGMIDVTEKWLKTKRDVAQAILATTADRPELSEPFLRVKTEFKAAIAEETDQFGKAMAIWASLEGLHFSVAHCVSILTEDERAEVLSELRRSLEQN